MSRLSLEIRLLELHVLPLYATNSSVEATIVVMVLAAKSISPGLSQPLPDVAATDVNRDIQNRKHSKDHKGQHCTYPVDRRLANLRFSFQLLARGDPLPLPVKLLKRFNVLFFILAATFSARAQARAIGRKFSVYVLVCVKIKGNESLFLSVGMGELQSRSERMRHLYRHYHCQLPFIRIVIGSRLKSLLD